MNFDKILYFLTIIFLLVSCSQKEIKKSVIKEKSLDLQVFEAYQEGKKSLESGDVLFAAKKFNESESLFPQSDWAPKAALMAAYSYYSQDYYGDAIAELDRFIRVYPLNKNLDYAYYLLGMCFYEQIVDEKKDTQSLIKSKEIFKLIIKKYPNSDYAIDVNYKLNLIVIFLHQKKCILEGIILIKKNGFQQ